VCKFIILVERPSLPPPSSSSSSISRLNLTPLTHIVTDWQASSQERRPWKGNGSHVTEWVSEWKATINLSSTRRVSSDTSHSWKGWYSDDISSHIDKIKFNHNIVFFVLLASHTSRQFPRGCQRKWGRNCTHCWWVQMFVKSFFLQWSTCCLTQTQDYCSAFEISSPLCPLCLHLLMTLFWTLSAVHFFN